MRNIYIAKAAKRNLQDVEGEMLLNNTRNMLHGIATLDPLFLKVILDYLTGTFEGYYYYEFDEVKRSFFNTKKQYKSLLEEDRKNKGLTNDLIKYKACAYHLYKKIKDIDAITEANGKNVSEINNVLSETLKKYQRLTDKGDLQNETLYKVLADNLYSTMKQFKLISDAELKNLLK